MLVGKWKLTETFNSDGGTPPEWTAIDNGYTYSFHQDGSFTSNRFSECTHGTYTLEANLLKLDFGCTDFTSGIESPKGTFIEEINFEKEFVILIPTYLTCFEGCKYKFEKLQ